ncbi:MAG: tail fiber protein [Alphaproteobacteria bacterium]|nr:tail fiber protein [Alphaproteobacteria bacterium]
MADSFMGQIIMFGGTFAIQGFTFCSGQLVQISQYSALYSLLGTFYGGDGRVTFGIPDLRGRSPIGRGAGPGLTNFYQVGLFGGLERITLGTAHMPTHHHTLTGGSSGSPATGTLQVATDLGNQPAPATDTYLSQASGGTQNFFKPPFGSPTLTEIQGLTISGGGGTVPTTTDDAGGSQSFPIRDPYLVITFQISLTGLYPSRN